MEQTELSVGYCPHPSSYVVNHFYENIETENGECRAPGVGAPTPRKIG